MIQKIHYTCEGCGLTDTSKKAIMKHETVCLDLMAKQKEFEAIREEAANLSFNFHQFILYYTC